MSWPDPSPELERTKMDEPRWIRFYSTIIFWPNLQKEPEQSELNPTHIPSHEIVRVKLMRMWTQRRWLGWKMKMGPKVYEELPWSLLGSSVSLAKYEMCIIRTGFIQPELPIGDKSECLPPPQSIVYIATFSVLNLDETADNDTGDCQYNL